MQRTKGAKITIWIILILMSLALVVPSSLAIIEAIFPSDNTSQEESTPRNVSITTEGATSEAERKQQEESDAKIQVSSSEAEKKISKIKNLPASDSASQVFDVKKEDAADEASAE